LGKERGREGEEVYLSFEFFEMEGGGRNVLERMMIAWKKTMRFLNLCFGVQFFFC